MQPHLPPQTEVELLAHANSLAGYTLGELAQKLHMEIPQLSLRAKGWGGQLLEILLGATAGSLAEPDFQHLGVELKTLPIEPLTLKPLESTYVSIVPLLNFTGLTWEQSELYQKLKRILWVPLQAQKGQPLHERQVGTAFIWSPTPEEEAILRQDWQELMDMVALGQLERITARHGRYLQIRPKGANAKSLCWGIDAEGNRIQTLPRGFYLRPQFTQAIMHQAFK